MVDDQMSGSELFDPELDLLDMHECVGEEQTGDDTSSLLIGQQVGHWVHNDQTSLREGCSNFNVDESSPSST